MYQIYTDGSCLNDNQAAGGGAAAVLVRDKQLLGAVVAKVTPSTNNIAEMLGVYLALTEVYPKHGRHYCTGHDVHWGLYDSFPDSCTGKCSPMGLVQVEWTSPWGAEDTQILSDSQYVVKGLNDWSAGWKLKGWKKADGEPVQNQAAWKALMKARAGVYADIVHVKGHVGHLYNELADVLAGDARITPMANLEGLYHTSAMATLTYDELRPMLSKLVPASKPTVRARIREQFMTEWPNPFLPLHNSL